MSIANREAVCNVLMELAQNDKTITVLCSDSRGSGSMTPFAQKYPLPAKAVRATLCLVQSSLLALNKSVQEAICSSITRFECFRACLWLTKDG